jgi:hypothetical protein
MEDFDDISNVANAQIVHISRHICIGPTWASSFIYRSHALRGNSTGRSSVRKRPQSGPDRLPRRAWEQYGARDHRITSPLEGGIQGGCFSFVTAVVSDPIRHTPPNPPSRGDGDGDQLRFQNHNTGGSVDPELFFSGLFYLIVPMLCVGTLQDAPASARDRRAVQTGSHAERGSDKVPETSGSRPP